MTPVQGEQLETYARDLYCAHPAALPLLVASIHGSTQEAKVRAAAALSALDPLVPVTEAQRSAERRAEHSARLLLGARHLHAVPSPKGADPDFNPDGPDAEKEPPPEEDPGPPPLVFVPAIELTKAAPSQWIVESVVVAGGITVLVGESGAGKTFVALGQAADIADGRDWFGLPTQRGSVAYVAYEGDAIGRRVQALRDHGADAGDLYVVRANEPLSPRILRDGIEVPSLGEQALVAGLRRLSRLLKKACYGLGGSYASLH